MFNGKYTLRMESSGCVFTYSQVKEHGDGRGEPWPGWFHISRPPWGRAKGGLAQEAEKHHEELAATMVCAALWLSLFLQGRGGDQAPGTWLRNDAFIVYSIYRLTRGQDDKTRYYAVASLELASGTSTLLFSQLFCDSHSMPVLHARTTGRNIQSEASEQIKPKGNNLKNELTGK